MRKSAPALAKFLKDLTNELGEDKVHVIAHSMGNYLLQQAVEILQSEEGGLENFSLNQLVMAAPDITVNTQTSLMAGLKDKVRGFTLYTSKNDFVLGLSRNLCDVRTWVEAFWDTDNEADRLDCSTRIGFISLLTGIPSYVPGIDIIDASKVTQSRLLAGVEGWHSYPFNDDVVSNDIKLILRNNGDQPVNERSNVSCQDMNNRLCPSDGRRPEQFFWRFEPNDSD